jgi:sugar lactone lactonase YvrE
VNSDRTLSGGEVLATCTAGTFDGVRLDHGGRIWAAAGDGLHCFDPDGSLIGKLLVPRRWPTSPSAARGKPPVHLRHQLALLGYGQCHRGGPRRH